MLPVRYTPRDLARIIDVSAVQAWHGEAEIRALVDVARRHRFIAVHVLPCWVPLLKDLLAGAEGIRVGAPAGFPGGAHRTAIKVAEAHQLVADGVEEMDMMINVGKLRSGDLGYVRDDIRAVVDAVAPAPVKVILETHYLNDDEICLGCRAAVEGGAAFVKTSTGWAPTGATLRVVELICRTVGDAVKVKASGGIRDLDAVAAMLRLGVQRFGVNVDAAGRILADCAALPSGTLTV
ncbi:MAG: deoxyribose-phosphate aldolase [Roseiarcus sp.]